MFLLPTLALLCIGSTLSAAQSSDYKCSNSYAGNCYDCLYNNAICNRANPSTIYYNGVIYTVNNTGPNWME